jgi:RNA polymerase sigma-70 factor (ECF subfamily)
MERSEILRQAVREGDESALERLLEWCRPLLWRYIRKRAKSEQDSEDILQEALLRVAHALPLLKPNTPLEPWLMRIASNCLHTFYQRVATTDIPFSHFETEPTPRALQQESPEPSIVTQMDTEQMARQLYAIIKKVCSETERKILLLCACDETAESIAVRLKLTVGTVRTHLMRGRAKVLAYIVQYQPALVGGTGRIRDAVRQLETHGKPSEQLTCAEEYALAHPKRNQLPLRRACLKIARFLEFPPAP